MADQGDPVKVDPTGERAVTRRPGPPRVEMEEEQPRADELLVAVVVVGP
jgi:hypothetical protein